MGLTFVLTSSSYPGYTIDFAYTSNPPPVVGWSIPDDKDTGYVNPGNFSNPDIICHKGAMPAQKYVTVAAGETVELQWTKWPESHHGPVIDYLANCNGECTTVEKTKLQFNKIDEMGLIDWTAMPGNWASDKLIAANNSWTVTVPKSVAPGNYVLRHEIIALHSSQNQDGAQNYPQCINLKVTGSGTDKLASGTLGTSLYKPDDAGIFLNIYNKLTSYTIPGPKLYSGASFGAVTSVNGASSTTASSGGYGAAPTSSASSAAAYQTTTLVSSPTAPFGNSTSPTSKPSKKPCTTAGHAVPKKGHYGPGVVNQASSTVSSTPSITIAPDAGAVESVSPSSVLSTPTGGITPVPSVAPESQTGSQSPEPKHQLPEGMTVQELLEWLEIIVAQLKAKLGSKVRRHARDFLDL
ncbi:MAG: hypothetical protein L6R41_006470 [Letrouitia leprolyta]|nr:MAG: hypothetical protein L6R41_006470 [Letrouitia leprolyta]